MHHWRYIIPPSGHVFVLHATRSRRVFLPSSPRRPHVAMVSYTALGFVIAAASAFFNGSFPAWSKLAIPGGDPVVFNGIVGLGAFLSSLIVPLIAGKAYVFSLPAMFGGVLFLGATLCTFIAIPKIGLGIGCATWSCTAIYVSFLWGVLGPEQVRAEVKSVTLSLLSLVCLGVGATIIVSADALVNRFWKDANAAPLTSGEAGQTGSSFVAKQNSQLDTGDAKGAGDRVVGLLFSLGTGLFGGSILLPMKFVPKSISGLETVVSFGIGAGIMSVLVTGIYWKCVAKQPGLPRIEGMTWLAGLLAGATWNAGNICQIIVQSDPISLAYGIAYPLGQCGMFFAGLWGIFAFGEIKGRAVGVFWIGAAMLAVGVVLLGLYGPQ